jgi:hypothetical protein
LRRAQPETPVLSLQGIGSYHAVFDILGAGQGQEFLAKNSL